MACIATRTIAMFRQALTDRSQSPTRLIVDNGVDPGGRRRYGLPHDVIQKPFSTEDRGRTFRVRGRRQERSMREQSTTLAGIRQSDASKTAAVHSGNAVLPGHPFVNEGVVRVDEFRQG